MKKVFLKFRPALFFTIASLAVLFFALDSCAKKPYTPPPASEGLKPTATNPWLPSKPYNYPDGKNDLATLGRVLFYDKTLSQDMSVSCGSCHQQAHGFADNKQFSTGQRGMQTPRNAHTIMQTNNSHFWDGKNQPNFSASAPSCTGYTCQTSGNGSVSFQTPTSVPFNTMEEFNISIFTVSDRIMKLPYYLYLFKKAFPNNPDMNEQNIELALGTFIGNITANNSKFARVKAGMEQFTASEQAGYAIFNGKAKCAQCHLEQNGFGGNPGQFEDVGLTNNYIDRGRGSVTGNSSDNGRFHVPSLNNVSLTAPYMHDGRFATLNDVVDFFDHGVVNSPNLSSAMTANPQFDTSTGGFFTAVSSFGLPPSPLNLTATEKSNLVSFLITLSDPTISSDVRFSDPFKH